MISIVVYSDFSLTSKLFWEFFQNVWFVSKLKIKKCMESPKCSSEELFWSLYLEGLIPGISYYSVLGRTEYSLKISKTIWIRDSKPKKNSVPVCFSSWENHCKFIGGFSIRAFSVLLDLIKDYLRNLNLKCWRSVEKHYLIENIIFFRPVRA
jgi:hypothetical protein